jgi:hypothetical protein
VIDAVDRLRHNRRLVMGRHEAQRLATLST